MLKKLLTSVTIATICACNAYAQSFDRPQEGSTYQADYDFEQIKYNDCLFNIVGESPFAYIRCLNQEIRRQESGMDFFFTELLKQEQFQKWNNSTSPTGGNIKDMMDQYNAFRDRFCSMYSIGMMNFYKNIEWGKKECIMKMNDEILRRLQRFYGESLADYTTAEDMESEERVNEEYNRSHQ